MIPDDIATNDGAMLQRTWQEIKHRAHYVLHVTDGAHTEA